MPPQLQTEEHLCTEVSFGLVSSFLLVQYTSKMSLLNRPQTICKPSADDPFPTRLIEGLIGVHRESTRCCVSAHPFPLLSLVSVFPAQAVDPLENAYGHIYNTDISEYTEIHASSSCDRRRAAWLPSAGVVEVLSGVTASSQ